MPNIEHCCSENIHFSAIGSLCPIFSKIGNARGAKLPPKLVVPRVFPYMKTPLRLNYLGQ